MIDKLRDINNKLIEKYSNDIKTQEKYILIGKLLSDDKCFFKMEIEYAYSILRDLNIPKEELQSVYRELIDPSNYDNKNV